MKWYEELELDENPFDVSSENSNFELISRKKEYDELYYQVESGNMCFLAGKSGYGKTAMLLTLQKEYDDREVVYIDAQEISKRYDLSEIFDKSENFVLLLDNVNHLSKQNLLKIKLDYDIDQIHSVVLAGSSLDLAKLDESIRERIGENVISLKEYSVTDAIKIVRSRLAEEDELVPEEVVENYFEKSEKNLKKSLMKI
jgi:Cdc6-like AAA superfamily ATPase